ncbi:MAG: rRNA methyltransferase [Spirochaetaceae bacterium]|nr:rRNA methyltransferase [Spirochaetaceae bacterium]
MLFPPLAPETRDGLERVLRLIDRLFPIPRRFRPALPKDVAALSKLLTSARAERPASYLSRPQARSAYLRYFLPWNLYRLCRLLPSLPLPLAPYGAVTDLGAGPLTLPLALWLSRPDLRSMPLEFRCVDKAGAMLDAGKALFTALAGADAPWQVKAVRAAIDAPLAGGKAALVSALNVFNERDASGYDRASFAAFARTSAGILKRRASQNGAVLAVEPGVPKSGAFIALVRRALLEQGYAPILPCPHYERCPLPEDKWCHFAFDTADAPAPLKSLAEAALIPKARATLSFLLAAPPPHESPEEKERKPGGKTGGKTESAAVRIISDPFPVSTGGGRYGRYGCSAQGLVLLIGGKGDMQSPALGFGALVEAAFKGRDPKTGALLAAAR